MSKHHDILGVSPNATSTEIRKAYQALVDLLGHDKDRNETTKKQFQAIKVAYNALINEPDVLIDSSKKVIRNTLSTDNTQLVVKDEEFSILIEKFIIDCNLPEEAVQKFKTFSPQQQQNLIDIYLQVKKDNLSVYTSASIKYNDSFTNMSDNKLRELISESDTKYQNMSDIVSNQKAFLWEARKDNAAPIYILSTLHLLTSNIFDDVIENILSKVSTVFTEIAVQHITPLEILGTLIYQLDVIIAAKAFEMNKHLYALEDERVREHFGLSVSLKSYLEQLKNFKDLEKTSHNYFTNIIPDTAVLNNETPQNRPHIRRNKFWMKSILETSYQQLTSLVICGAVHNFGKYGLPNLLASEGYTLRPVITSAPTSRSETARILAFGDNRLSFIRSTKSEQETSEKKSLENKKSHFRLKGP